MVTLAVLFLILVISNIDMGTCLMSNKAYPDRNLSHRIPRDCVWAEWTIKEECPSCDYFPEDPSEQERVRRLKDPGNKYGKCINSHGENIEPWLTSHTSGS